MQASPRASRRSLLQKGLLFLAGVVGVGVAGEKIARAGSPSPSGVTKLALFGRQWHLFSQDRRRGELPVRGDRIATYGALHDANGKKVGEFYSTGFVLQNPLGSGPFGAANLEVHTFNLREGTIAGIGSAQPRGSAFAIVGGTGRYSGATGSYVARQRPLEMGGDGTAKFTLTLRFQEADHGR